MTKQLTVEENICTLQKHRHELKGLSPVGVRTSFAGAHCRSASEEPLLQRLVEGVITLLFEGLSAHAASRR